MTQIVLDASVASKLYAVPHAVKLCDPTGRVLGTFIPSPDPSAFEGLESPLSKEELDQRKKTKGKTYSTAEVLAHLEKL